MSKIKTVLKKTLENSLEFVKPLGKLGSADSAVTQLIGVKQPEAPPKSKKNEISEYFENVGDPSITPAQVEEKKKEDEAQVQDYRKTLDPQSGIASHLRIPDLKKHRDPKKGRYYEIIEEKEAQERQKQMLEGPQEFVVPTSKPARGSLSGKIKRQESSMETKQSWKTQ